VLEKKKSWKILNSQVAQLQKKLFNYMMAFLVMPQITFINDKKFWYDMEEYENKNPAN
jgi:hypothetical protein